MGKKVLALYYTQTGQVKSLLDNFTKDLSVSEEVRVDYVKIEPKTPFPFPWPFFKFFKIFPESVYMDKVDLKEEHINTNTDYDLIIFAYQPWFLSPSIPASSFLQTETAKKLLKDKPVITLIGSRNMWFTAQEKIKGLLSDIGAKLVGNVVLVDQGNSLSTFVTTPRWMLTGKKDRLWNILPKAGISEKEINDTGRFGKKILEAFQNNTPLDENLLKGLGAVKADIKLIGSEKIAHRSFLIWGKLLRKIGSQDSFARLTVLIMYILFLITIIATVVPLSMAMRTLLFPLMKEKLYKEKEYYEYPSGSETYNIEKR